MTREYENKWNKHKIGKIPWIDVNREHSCRKNFVEYTLTNEYDSILEIGAGELIEARLIAKHKKRYAVVDISDTFLSLCNKYDIEFRKGNMIEVPYDNKEFDLAYASSVLEHSPNIEKTIQEINRVSKTFYFNLFKWKMKSGNLVSFYKKNKKYYSTMFNIDSLIELISRFGVIKNSFITERNNDNVVLFSEYRKKCKLDKHRNGKYLTLYGAWKI